ncbi:PepSY domain-containing protein [Halomonas sp. PR-M31]|uniref:PepSY domain-containing protein n=1 Tax=Halomonas sp. PR-M31 TaxID=1471202 RepID=UPI0006510A40|nr:PepSY domain-containing protein [Halomonas sp. PR-M31]
MRKLQIAVGIAALGLVSISGLSFADQPGEDWISMDKVKSILEDDGYSQVSEIQADDGHWEGEGMKNGEKYEFHVDPKSGEITKNERDSDD